MIFVPLDYFYLLGKHIGSVVCGLEVQDPLPASNARFYLDGFIKDTEDDSIVHDLSESRKKAQFLLVLIDGIIPRIGELNPADIVLARSAVNDFEHSLIDEFQKMYVFRIDGKGNLSVHRLVKGASQGYPSHVAKIIDGMVKNEIDEAGKCLACNRPTACGFHILRSVEMCIKAYVYAGTGSLPNLTERSWPKYIEWLEQKTKASKKLIAVLRILKDMRNPLMHPQESLEVYHAIDMLCICQAVIEKIIEDVSSQKLEEQFTNAWEALKKLKKLEDNTRSIRLNSFRLLNRYSKRQVFRRDFMIDPPLRFPLLHLETAQWL